MPQGLRILLKQIYLCARWPEANSLLPHDVLHGPRRHLRLQSCLLEDIAISNTLPALNLLDQTLTDLQQLPDVCLSQGCSAPSSLLRTLTMSLSMYVIIHSLFRWAIPGLALHSLPLSFPCIPFILQCLSCLARRLSLAPNHSVDEVLHASLADFLSLRTIRWMRFCSATES